MTDLVIRALQSIHPEDRVRWAARGLLFTLLAWPSTHVLILITKPPELAAWTGHLLLAISWIAITVTFIDIIVGTDVRRQQEGENS